jgi:hypothetical protein
LGSLADLGGPAAAADYGESSQKRVGIHGENRRPTWPSDLLPGDYSVTFRLYRMKPLSCEIFATAGNRADVALESGLRVAIGRESRADTGWKPSASGGLGQLVKESSLFTGQLLSSILKCG